MAHLIELAIKGTESATLAKHIAAMNPSLLVAERIVSGIPTINPDKLAKYMNENYNGATVIDYSIGNGFIEDCLRVDYRMYCTRWISEDFFDETSPVPEREFRKWCNDKHLSIRTEKDEICKYAVTISTDHFTELIPERFV